MNNRLDEREVEALVQGYLESSLTEQESARLHSLLRQNPAKVDLILSGLRDDLLIRTVVTESMVASPAKSSGVAQRPEFSPWMPTIVDLLCRYAWSWRTVGSAAFPALIAAAVFGVWYFNPTVGEPALEGVQGPGLILERAGHRLPAGVGVRLQPGDVLRTPENVTAFIGYAPENTRIKVLPETELTLTAFSRGKLFELGLGKLEATVSRQTPFRPMIIATPQAQALIVGTRFTLLVTNNSTRLDVTEGKVRFTRLSDEKFVQVSAGHYAVAAADYELAALPFTGNILREWWINIPGDKINTFRDNPRFPNHPDGRDFAKALELQTVKTNHVGMRFCAYLRPPATGNYEFWVAGATDAQLFMSPNENPAEKVLIGNDSGFHGTNWDQPRFQGGSQWAPPVPLVAGRTYYIEAIVFIYAGEGDLSVAWKRPGASRELLTGEYLSPFKTE